MRGGKRHPGSHACAGAAERRNARENKSAPVSATVINYHPFGTSENSSDTHEQHGRSAECWQQLLLGI